MSTHTHTHTLSLSLSLSLSLFLLLSRMTTDFQLGSLHTLRGAVALLVAHAGFTGAQSATDSIMGGSESQTDSANGCEKQRLP